MSKGEYIRDACAGGLIRGPGNKYAIVEYKGVYSLPKGHLDPFEWPIEASEREVWEETGLEAHELDLILQFDPYERLSSFTNELKTITLFLYYTKQRNLKPAKNENGELKAYWVDFEELENLLTHEQDKKLVREYREGLTQEMKIPHYQEVKVN